MGRGAVALAVPLQGAAGRELDHENDKTINRATVAVHGYD
jgi:hypothetical protein